MALRDFVHRLDRAANAPQIGTYTSALAADTSTGLELGKDGQRIISLKSVQKEIWLNHGAITMKRLMKIFTIKKKAGPERMNKFREVVRELCTMKQDNVEGNMLVLKPHYSKM